MQGFYSKIYGPCFQTNNVKMASVPSRQDEGSCPGRAGGITAHRGCLDNWAAALIYSTTAASQ